MSKKIINVLCCVSMIMLLVGCGNSSEEELIGKWKRNTEYGDSFQYVEFFDDGRMIEYYSEKGKSEKTDKDEFVYKVSENTIKLDSGESLKYSIVGNKLTIQEDIDKKRVFEKVK